MIQMRKAIMDQQVVLQPCWDAQNHKQTLLEFFINQNKYPQKIGKKSKKTKRVYHFISFIITKRHKHQVKVKNGSM